TEFGANKPGTVFYDDTTDHLYELFQSAPLSAYYVAEKNGELIGGAGIFPTEGLPANTCELVKMYLHKSARGMG
ncbi:GNAT family N-acetyltransferase, partial [Escherichia coli]|uniref:GNAT family N-acetyltransferase n=1 Tax=Escherichia coli TaxID=562 RepID=UPI0013D5AD57